MCIRFSYSNSKQCRGLLKLYQAHCITAPLHLKRKQEGALNPTLAEGPVYSGTTLTEPISLGIDRARTGRKRFVKGSQ